MTASPTIKDWDWTEDIWNWSPLHGPWRPELGSPSRCVSLGVSTDQVTPNEAYDSWRETVFHDFAADRRPSDAQPFTAWAKALISPRTQFSSFASASLSGQRTAADYQADGNADFYIGFVVSGSRRHSFGEQRHLAHAGDVYLYDPSMTSQVEWADHEGFQLALRRSDVAAAIGHNQLSAETLLAELKASPILPFLRNQLFLLSRTSDGLSLNQKETILNASVDLALSMLREAPAEDQQTNHRRGLMVAAEQFIVSHIADPKLNARTISNALGCSRATLYRAFADHDKTVAEQIRVLRLIRIRKMLEQSPPHVTITDIIAAYGFE